MFPRLAIHTGNSVVPTNKHPEWEGTVVIQHNETTSTMLKYGSKLSRKARKRHPLLSTFQSNCEAGHWAPYHSCTLQECQDNDVWDGILLGQQVTQGQLVSATEPPTIGVQPAVEHC
jgi:hypothetical protein